MFPDVRAKTARYYELGPNSTPKDINFYKNLIRRPEMTVLELGCGTGRILVPLAHSCAYIQGIDSSPAMLDICRERLEAARIGPDRAAVVLGDMCGIALGRKFGLIIAPYRVMQNLETNEQVHGMLRCIRSHLAADGTCVLNAFNPNRDKDRMRREWCREGEMFMWSVPYDEGRVEHYEAFREMDQEGCILYPELIYRRFVGEQMVEETIMKIPMRCWWPRDFEGLLVDHGFTILNKWGGYAGEPYGQESELVIEFADGRAS